MRSRCCAPIWTTRPKRSGSTARDCSRLRRATNSPLPRSFAKSCARNRSTRSISRPRSASTCRGHERYVFHDSLTDHAQRTYSAWMSLSLDVRDLSLVREVADTGSVTRAGARLHLTQSALSHRLRSVEERLGSPLFLRLGKKMVLTPSGERVLETAHRVLDELVRAEDDLRVLGVDGSGVLRLCTQCYTGYHWLAPLMRAFQEKHPRINIQIAVDATYRPVDALLASEIDLAVMTVLVDDPRLLVRP